MTGESFFVPETILCVVVLAEMLVKVVVPLAVDTVVLVRGLGVVATVLVAVLAFEVFLIPDPTVVVLAVDMLLVPDGVKYAVLVPVMVLA